MKRYTFARLDSQSTVCRWMDDIMGIVIQYSVRTLNLSGKWNHTEKRKKSNLSNNISDSRFICLSRKIPLGITVTRSELRQCINEERCPCLTEWKRVKLFQIEFQCNLKSKSTHKNTGEQLRWWIFDRKSPFRAVTVVKEAKKKKLIQLD